MQFSHAIVRPPSQSFAAGLTSAGLGPPDLARALQQHAQYCAMLERCGLALTALRPENEFPDSTFVEDTALVTRDFAILTRPGAAAREGEVACVEPALRARFERIHAIAAPGSVDGGDVCRADGHWFIGVSERSNETGAHQLCVLLAQEGFTSSVIDIRGVEGILHLKSGISYLGDKRIVAIDALASHPAFEGYEVVRIAPQENYAANFLRLNDHVVVAAGYPGFAATVRGFGYATIELDMSEFRKMDGALSCLSLRY